MHSNIHQGLFDHGSLDGVIDLNLQKVAELY